jgi:hypothetical protein
VTAAAGASHDVQGQHQLDQQQHMLQGNYCCRLMAAATEEQWQQAAQMTPHVSHIPRPHPLLCCGDEAAADAHLSSHMLSQSNSCKVEHQPAALSTQHIT